ncbi:MAG: glycosyltransferase, partial [Pseudomonas sp.]|nr:glycosyltransferase [Pseudomonas sp.]
TPIGSEGMHGDLPWPGVIASNPQALADAAVQLYQDQAVWQQAQDAGWQLLAARYEKTRFAKQLMTRISECRGQLSEHRRDNFTGTMLRHHHHKSTQYMAQWIAAKNRLQGA